MWIKENLNPCGRNVGDCAVRAVATVLDATWEEAYRLLANAGLKMCDMPNSNATVGAVLRMHGYAKEAIPNICPDCYTIGDFCHDNPRGKYVVGTGTHVAAVINGDLIDAWDSSNEIPIYVWYERFAPDYI